MRFGGSYCHFADAGGDQELRSLCAAHGGKSGDIDRVPCEAGASPCTCTWSGRADPGREQERTWFVSARRSQRWNMRPINAAGAAALAGGPREEFLA
jgi:hypothetical protein